MRKTIKQCTALGLSSLAGLLCAASLSAAAPTTPQGTITAKTFANIGGTAVTDLTGNAKFPDSPDSVAYPSYFELNATGDISVQALDTADNYGAQMVGYFYPDVTGDYTFYLAADDGANLYLSTDEAPANKKLIAQETGWSGTRSYTAAGGGSTAEAKDSSKFAATEWATKDTVNGGAKITLTKGKAYYIEALVKEGGGGDNLSVSIDGTLPIAGSFLSPFLASAAPQILGQPQDAYVYAGGTATFSVGVDVPPPATLTSIKWQKNGTDIPNSNTNRLSLVAAAGDNGAKIKAVVTTSAGALTSNEANLTVATIANEFALGVVKFEAYHDITGVAVADLLASEKFPSQPDNMRLLGGIDTPNGYGDNYGARVTGFILPPETASYHFFINSDDASQFFLSLTETAPDPTSETPICEETGCCNAFTEPAADHSTMLRTSEPIALVAGKKYAFVALVKEGGGGDYLRVAARKVGDTTPAASLSPLSGSWVGANAKPSLGTPVISKQPESLPNLLQGRSGVLSIEASITPTAYNFPLLIQWKKNGAAIPGASALTYTIPSASASDSGTYSAVVSAPSGQSVTSADAVVAVQNDTFAPKISKVKASTVSTLIVTFDEPVEKASAEVVGNYSLSDGVTISKATASGSSVLLDTSSLTVGNFYTLTAGGVKDLYGNALAAGTKVSFKVAVVTYADVILADAPVMFYRFEEATGQTTKNYGTAGTAADGKWMTGNGPDDSVATDASSGTGPRPGDFLGFAPDNRSGLFTGGSTVGGGDLWVDAQQQLLNGLASFSLEYWVKPKNRASDPTAFGTRIGIVGQNDAVEYGFINQTTIQIWTPGGGSLDTTYSFPDETWHHVATIADGKSIKNYFDGKFINQITQTSANYGSSTYNVHVGGGGAFDATGNFFTGEIDEVAIFTKAIPADRIAAHYKAGKEGGELPSASEVDYGVGLNFGADEPESKNGGTLLADATAGVPGVIQANWNNLTLASGTNAFIVADKLGTAVSTSMKVVWTSPNTWSSTGRGEENNKLVGSDLALLTGYLDTGASTTTTVEISNVPTELTSTGYDVYVYALGGVAGRGGGYSITDASGAALTDWVHAQSPANPTNYVQVVPQAGTWAAGNYMVFKNLSASSIKVLGSTANGHGFSGTPRAGINAIQLVPTSGGPVTGPKMTIALASGNVTINWEGSGTLQSATSVNGPWTDIGTAKPYTTAATGAAMYYRVKQ